MAGSADSSDFYTDNVIKRRSRYFESHGSTDDTTRRLIEQAAGHIDRGQGKRLLDIGTGNGFVLTEVLKEIEKPSAVELRGVDLSENMVQEAKIRCAPYPQITITRADNFKLPFANESFDVVTNKLSTHFSIGEVFRVLKHGGLFVFKEYGLFKGFKEISELFSGRIGIKDPLEYVRELMTFPLKCCSFDQFYVVRTYSIEELADIFSMAPIIRDFDPDVDMKTIAGAFGANNIRVIADPFLIVARK